MQCPCSAVNHLYVYRPELKKNNNNKSYTEVPGGKKNRNRESLIFDAVNKSF